MECKKYTLINQSQNTYYFSYQKCCDLVWQYQAELLPNQVKRIWVYDDTLITPYGNPPFTIIYNGITSLCYATTTTTLNITPTQEPTNTPTPTELVVTPTPTELVVTPTPTELVVTPTPTESAITPTPTQEPTNTPTLTLTPTPTTPIPGSPWQPVLLEPYGGYLATWYEISTLSSVYLIDNQSVSSWLSSYNTNVPAYVDGEGWHQAQVMATQTIPNFRPKIKKNYLSGNTDALYFDGDDWFSANFSSLYGNFYSNSFTFYTVVKPQNSAPVFENYWGIGFISGETGYTPYLSYESTVVLSGDPVDNSEFIIIGATVSFININLHIMRLSVNGVVYTGTPINNILLPKYEYLGGNYYNNFVGYMTEALYYYFPLYEDDRQRLEGYLAHKYDLAGVLPVDHPYKLNPPVY